MQSLQYKRVVESHHGQSAPHSEQLKGLHKPDSGSSNGILAEKVGAAR